MKKIAIMTWHNYDNYGGVLQAYALSKAVEQFDYDSYMIDYSPVGHVRRNIIIRILKTPLYSVLKNAYYKYRFPLMENNNKVLFSDFRKKNFRYTDLCETSSDFFKLNKNYDAFICGSDQIWAPSVYDSKYFLDFVNSSNKKVAYAPSVGLPIISDENVKDQMRDLINDISYLSVRESQGANLIKEITGRSAEVVLDPTLLLNSEQWANILELDKIDKKYILYYFLGDNYQNYRIAKKISKNTGMKLIIVPINKRDFYYEECYKNDISPVDFVSLIKNANLVLTDSFHGVVFSINFNIPFIAFKRFKDNNLSQNSRIYNILKVFELENRLYDNDIEYFYDNYANIDFLKVNDKLNCERKKSFEFLRSSLEKATNASTLDNIITKDCTGCGLCSVICPKNCISIDMNKDGFYQAKIDYDKCINCKLCQKVCGQNFSRKDMPLVKNAKLYSAYSNDEDVLKHSSSGGIAYEISKNKISKGLSILGCEYNYSKNIANHIVISKLEDIQRTSGSKYIQSYTADCFKKIEKLDGGVIFGTPCQIASIHMYLTLKNKRDNFLLVDLICHGVPSYNLWKKYLENVSSGKMKKVIFRDKNYGWRKMLIHIVSNNNYYCYEKKDFFFNFFTSGLVYNKCCYECNFRDRSLANIRLGDYWGDKFKDNKTGISMVTIFNDQGAYEINELIKKSKINAELQSIDDYLKNQQTVNYRIPLNYSKMMNDFSNSTIDINHLQKTYYKPYKRGKSIRKVYYKLKKMLGK